MKTPTQTDFLSTVAPATLPRSAAIIRIAKEWRRFHGEPLQLPLETIIQITPAGRKALALFMKRTETKPERKKNQ